LEAYAASRAEMMQALQLCQTLGHVRGELACLSNLAWSDFFVGDYAVAQQRFEQGFQLACTLGNRWTEMSTCMGLGEVMRLQGQYTQALHFLTRSITIAIEDGHTYTEVMVAAILVRLHSYLGDQSGAEVWCSRLFQLLQRTKLPKDCQRQGLLAAAEKAHYAGAAQTALAYAEQARQLTGPGDILNHQADALVILGHTQVGMAQLDAAVESYQVAITYYTKVGNRAAATEAQAGLAQVALLQGAPDQAQSWVDAILPILIAQPRAGFTTPFFTYLTCYRVLVANQDPRAQPLWQQGWALLQHDAQQIDDTRLRTAFLEKVAVHVELQARIS